MAFLDQSFSLDELPVSTSSFEPLPAGWYTAIINKAEVKTTKTGDGEYISVRYDITGPTHQGRVVFGNINFKNPNAKAEEVARKQLGEIMRAIGLNRVSDTDQLIGGQLSIKLVVQNDAQYGDRNEIKGFKAAGGSMPLPVALVAATAPTPATAPSKSSPPWGKK